MSLIKSSAERAAARVAEVEATLAKWAAEESAATAELDDLRGRVGDEVLDDEAAAGRLAEQMAALRTRADIAHVAAVAAERRLEVARRDLCRAWAGQLRADAERLRRTADERQRRTEALLAQLAEHEGVPYGPRARVVANAAVSPPTRTEGLRLEAAHLDAQAVELDIVAGGGRSAEAVEQHAAAAVLALTSG